MFCGCADFVAYFAVPALFPVTEFGEVRLACVSVVAYWETSFKLFYRKKKHLHKKCIKTIVVLQTCEDN